MSLRVLVVGAGVGGLCLAQGLRRRRVEVDVYDRGTPEDWPLTGLLRVNRHGDAALSGCLPTELYDLYQATRDRFGASPAVFYDHHLNQLTSTDPGDGPARGWLVDRQVLRHILLAGLSDSVHFGRLVEGYEQGTDGIRLGFADGTTTTGDVLVAADGINSVIRRQMLPHFEVIDTGLRAIHGHVPLHDTQISDLPEPLLRNCQPVHGPHRCTLLLRPFQPYLPPKRAAAEFAPYARLPPLTGYLRWTLVLPMEWAGAGRLTEADTTALRQVALHATEGWHPAIRGILDASQPSSISAAPIRASMPMHQWSATAVTALGEAIHVAPTVGELPADLMVGAAALLTTVLSDVRDPASDLLPAIDWYEKWLRYQACDSVSRSLRDVVEWETRHSSLDGG